MLLMTPGQKGIRNKKSMKMMMKHISFAFDINIAYLYPGFIMQKMCHPGWRGIQGENAHRSVRNHDITCPISNNSGQGLASQTRLDSQSGLCNEISRCKDCLSRSLC